MRPTCELSTLSPARRVPRISTSTKSGLPFRIERVRERQMREVLVQLDALLPAVFVDLLAEVAVPVEQREGDERQVEIARRFAVVAGENAEAAGVVRERFVKAELRARNRRRRPSRAALRCAACRRYPAAPGRPRTSRDRRASPAGNRRPRATSISRACRQSCSIRSGL